MCSQSVSSQTKLLRSENSQLSIFQQPTRKKTAIARRIISDNLENASGSNFKKYNKMNNSYVHERDFVRPDEPRKCLWPSKEPNPHPTHDRPSYSMAIRDNILDCIGNTPLVRLNTIPKMFGVECEMLVKCEFLNPCGSVKDRMAYRMVLDAEKQGKLIRGRSTIIEPTSGNTGIALALISAVRGYKCIIVMVEKMSGEKVKILEILGAKIIRVPNNAPYNSPGGLFSVTQKLQSEIPDSVILNQFTNASNPMAHYETTANEILEQCGGHLSAVVGGAGTGGTLSGIARRFKEKNPTVRVVCVDPHGSTLAIPDDLNKVNMCNFYFVEGIGYDFVPLVLDRSLIDEWVKVSDKEAFRMARNLVKYEGLLCGGSSGALMHGAIQVAKTLSKTDRVVVILPDNIRNYLTKHALDDWMYAWDFYDAPKPLNTVSGDLLKKLASKPTLKPDSILKEALTFMVENNYDYMPVVNENRIIEGVLTVKNMMKMMLESNTDQSIVKSDSLLNNKVIDRIFRKVTMPVRIDQLVRHLQVEPFVIMVDGNFFKQKLDQY